MNALMADVYGHQRLLQTGVLPASVLFQSPGWLLPCYGIQPPGGVYLHSYGVQLARGRDGNWVVLSDRTQGASGAGYLVEDPARQVREPGAGHLTFRLVQPEALLHFPG